MAMNPMQRRARNSFLMGVLVAVIIMSLIIIFLLYQMKGINQENDSLKALQRKVYVAGDYIQSGTEVTLDSFVYETIQTNVDSSELINDSVFEYIDEKTGDIILKYDQEGNPIEKKMVVKTNIVPGTIITKDMLEEIDDKTTSDQRIQEYNMIILPTLLVNGDFIDVRLQLPSGEDYIVVSKKKVIYTDASTVWLKMGEDEILSLGNAIVEAYTLPGSKLYATTYTEPGRQVASTPTYPVSAAVPSLINSDPNVLKEARDGLWNRYNAQGQVDQRNQHIESALEPYKAGMKESVEAGLQEEITKLQEGRQQYVDSLQGTGMVGTE